MKNSAGYGIKSIPATGYNRIRKRGFVSFILRSINGRSYKRLAHVLQPATIDHKKGAAGGTIVLFVK